MRNPIQRPALISAAAVLFTLSALAQPALQQPSSAGSWRFLAGYHSEQPSASEAISILLRVAEVPSGFAVQRSCEAGSPVAFEVPPGMELRAALDEIVALTGAAFRQEERSGVLNVLPASGIPLLLKVRIAKLTLQDPANLMLSLSQLEQTPEFERTLLAAGSALWVRASLWSSLRQPGEAEPSKPQPLEIRDMLAIDVLNLLAMRHGQAVWLYSETHCAGQRPRVELGFLRQ